MPFLLKVHKGKEKRIVETLHSHAISAAAAPIGEYVVCDRPFQIEIIDPWVFSTTEITDEIASAILEGSLQGLLPICLTPGRIVCITAGDYTGQMAVVRNVVQNDVHVDVIVEGRMYPLTVIKDALKAPEVSATWR